MLSKDPSVSHGGDVTMSKLVAELARESVDVRMLCLSAGPLATETELPFAAELRKVAKPDVSLPKVLLNSLRTGRSLVHTRFSIPAFTEALDAMDSDLFIADHSYMAESFLRSRHAGKRPLLVSTHVPESLVWTASRGLVGRLDSGRIRGDELRVARAAHAVGTFDGVEAEDYRTQGVERVHWLDVTFPAGTKCDVGSSGRRLVFLGDRSWPPNQEAFQLLLQWWPEISTGIAGAELLVIGKPAGPAPKQALPAGMQDLGFVDDLDAVLGSCRGLVAPILTGGGVRVKILDAASRGLPVVGTEAAVGSLSEVFGLPTFDSKESFVARCRELLLDAAGAAREGNRIFELNAGRWNSGVPHNSVEKWLAC